MTQRNAHVLIISRILFPLAFKQHASPKILIPSHKHAALPALMLLTTKKEWLMIIQLKNKLHRNVVCSVTALPIALSLYWQLNQTLSSKAFILKKPSLSHSRPYLPHSRAARALSPLSRSPCDLRSHRSARLISFGSVSVFELCFPAAAFHLLSLTHHKLHESLKASK